MASDKVDLSLDEIIKKSKDGRGRGRGGRGNFNNRRSGSFQQKNGGGNAVQGVTRGNQASNRRGRTFLGGVIRGGVTKRSNKSFIPRNLEEIWNHDLFEETVGFNANNAAIEGQLIISNLDFGVNDSDIKELFSEFGMLKKAAVHYDFSGRSQGTAEVIFASKQAALQAMNRYNYIPLDGRPMKIQIVENSSIENRLRRGFSSSNNNAIGGRGSGRVQNKSFNNNNSIGNNNRSFNSSNNSFNRSNIRRGFNNRRGGRGGRGRGGRLNQPVLTKEELDAQLDSYNKMETE
ncbi:hypothetical protein HELRODRAFT_97663 [Helobdella robusta]|uniref:RRM domain-containing protein n=1 Tax=Helobdella robusta TaxID=6412 RepID=T1G9I4_HELRO|nr:hypothetical protein HELRODRAFT_97663 [Helobdella robusta]ESO09592.1 hypothetical protein HELRODRAFT_97663 [Helobdella robusta]